MNSRKTISINLRIKFYHASQKVILSRFMQSRLMPSFRRSGAVYRSALAIYDRLFGLGPQSFELKRQPRISSELDARGLEIYEYLSTLEVVSLR